MEQRITGIMIYYYIVCKRKLWYFTHNICMEHTNEDVAIGKLIDENCYSGEDKHIDINNEINIDFIKNNSILHEVKKSRKIEEASILQVKYYLYYLSQRGVKDITAKIDYPLLRQTIDVQLSGSDCQEIENIIDGIMCIINAQKPQEVRKTKICRKCSYFDLCFV